MVCSGIRQPFSDVPSQYRGMKTSFVRKSKLAGTRNNADHARCRCSVARFRDCWAVARNEVLRFAGNIRRIAHGRRSVSGRSAPKFKSAAPSWLR
jgi:hypothetical protein